MTDYLTFKELEALEQAANKGDKEAQEKLNNMARDEGYSDYASMDDALAKESLPVWEAQIKQHEDYIKRRDKISNIKPVIAYFEKLRKSQSILDRANYKSALYSQIFTMAKAVDSELMSIAQDSPDLDAVKTESKSSKRRVYIAWVIEESKIWRRISPYIKDGFFLEGAKGYFDGEKKDISGKKVNAKNCIAFLRSKPGHEQDDMSPRRMRRIIKKGYAREYDTLKV